MPDARKIPMKANSAEVAITPPFFPASGRCWTMALTGTL